MVTPLQIARAFCAIANGGRLVTPRILLGTVDPDGDVLSRQPPIDFEFASAGDRPGDGRADAKDSLRCGDPRHGRRASQPNLEHFR